MSCRECDALAAKRDRQWRAYSDAVARLNQSYASTDSQYYTNLRRAADAARIDFNLAENAFREHQDRHAAPN